MAKNEKTLIKSYRDLRVWQKAMDLATEIYQLAKLFSDAERFWLTSQIQRAVVSVPANIAEGNARLHRADYLRHLSYACGSLAETETHLILAIRLKYLARDQALPAWRLAEDVRQLLYGLVRALERDPARITSPVVSSGVAPQTMAASTAPHNTPVGATPPTTAATAAAGSLPSDAQSSVPAPLPSGSLSPVPSSLPSVSGPRAPGPGPRSSPTPRSASHRRSPHV